MTYFVTTWKENDQHLTKAENIRSFSTWKKANRYYQKKRRVFKEKWSWVNKMHNPGISYGEYAPGGCDKDGDGPYVEKLCVSKKFGCSEGIKLTAYLDI